ncbi:hypothetical protein UP12_14265 [Bacillus pumilus]|nr:hypothetical protein [Bacillus pumilus]AMM98438.1 hypothetical protein UP12_14265 [Bacillus pumilus]
MNKLEISLSQTTLDSFIKRNLENFKQETTLSEVIIERSGVKVIGNVHIEKIKINNLSLNEPNLIDLNNVEVQFRLLNIVIEVDIERIHDELKIGGVRVFSWDFFGANPDIRLTIGLEDFVQPNFSASMKCFVNNRDIIVGLNNFDLHSLNLPNDIASRIQNNVIDEMKNYIKDKIPGKWEDKIIDIIGNLARYLPISNLGDWIFQQISNSKVLEKLIEKAVRDQVKDEVVYSVPPAIELGSGNKKVSIVFDETQPFNVEVKEQQLISTVNFKDL